MSFARSDRRTFLECLAATLLVSRCESSFAAAQALNITASDGTYGVQAKRYAFRYRYRTDQFEVADEKGLTIASGPLQPIVRIHEASNESEDALWSPGTAQEPVVEGNRLLIRYAGVNGGGTLSLALRFDEEVFWLEPIVYQTGQSQDVVSLHYFVHAQEHVLLPGLRATFTVVPGIAENTSISPVQTRVMHYQNTISLGHSGFAQPPYTHQQWGLPVHYYCMMSTDPPASNGSRDRFTKYRSSSMICGLADLPGGDLLLDLESSATSPWIDYRSDLWRHLRTPGTITLGATLAFAFGEDTYAAIQSYYQQLMNGGKVRRKVNSAAKNRIVAAPQLCTWGAQVARNAEGARLTETFVRDLYAEMKSVGMKASVFSIDDKWEGRYGSLEHDPERFPKFAEFLDTVRAEGHVIGLWAAFMRCEKPEDLGLTPAQMLMQPDGTPYRAGGDKYYLLDFTRPEVEKILADRARAFVRNYKPAVVKFDFGYELPQVRHAAPFDKRFAGERILGKGLEIVVGALREENPDIVVMYYQLSPLFSEYFDLHSTDDLYLTMGDYDWEANRRIYFASALAELGITVYGSSGYDWSSSPPIWFDSIAAGTIGSLNDFREDELGESATPERIALYNGFTQIVRQGNSFTVIPFPPTRPEAASRGDHSRSWARIEGDEVTIVAQRPPSFDVGDMLDWRRTDPRVDGIVTTTVPVAICSMTEESIVRSDRLGIVVCEEGTVQLRRTGGSSATIMTHYFGGATSTSEVEIRDGLLTLRLAMKGSDGTPVEWREVHVT